jgi:RNA polymerase sigma factor (sigma-70 family)
MSATTDMEISELFQRIVQDPKDEFALGLLIELLRGPALGWIRKNFNILTEDDADTVFSEATFRLYAHARSIKNTTSRSVKSYFYKTMRNLAFDVVNRIKIENGWLVDLDDEHPGSRGDVNQFSDHWVDNTPEIGSPQRSIEKILERKQGLAELRSKLTLMESNVFDDLASGLSQTEIAKKHSITRGRVSQICKTIKMKNDLTIGEEVKR